MLKVVLDTNLLVSGIFFKGQPGKVLDAWIDNQFALYTSPQILEEYRRVILDFSKNNEQLAGDWLHLLTELSHVVNVQTGSVGYSRDPEDDKFVYCGLGAKADYLVSGDKDLLTITKPLPFRVITAAKFLTILSKKDP